jgi:hypothetical protein
LCEHTFAHGKRDRDRHPELLDRLTDALGAEPDFTLRRLGLKRLEAAVTDAAEFLVRMRVEGKLTTVARDWRHLAEVR